MKNLEKMLPLGTEDFRELREENFYYIDKTMLIKDLIEGQGKVTLFTRPRRFGKTLNMSMLRHFFEIGTDKAIFEGLAISDEKELCKEYMGQYPVISISLKGVEGENYESAKESMWSVIKKEARRLSFLQQSDSLNEIEKSDFIALCTGVGRLEESLNLMSELLYKHYGKKVIVLIDEYDVPLDKAYHQGYYDKMILLIRQLFGNVLKTNEYLNFAVLTGCLRVSKESIFTGLNNLIVHTIAEDNFAQYFGFTDKEVLELLSYYGVEENYSLTKEWYDGYCFGQSNRYHVYCPWDVINWCYYLKKNPNIRPQNFWVNTSSNDLIRTFAQMADNNTRQEIADLIDGKHILKKLDLNLTYAEIEENINNLWSVLYMTGYLTSAGTTRMSESDQDQFELFIPNKEIRSIFIEKVNKWFSDKVLEDEEDLREFVDCFIRGDGDDVQDCLLEILEESVSYLDGGQTIELKESFYHGLLIGMLQSNRSWIVRSNREVGNGRADIIVYPRRKRFGNSAFIIEVKYAKTRGELKQKAIQALAQIEDRKCDNFFLGKKIEMITHYGISFYGKECCVMTE